MDIHMNTVRGTQNHREKGREGHPLGTCQCVRRALGSAPCILHLRVRVRGEGDTRGPYIRMYYNIIICTYIKIIYVYLNFYIYIYIFIHIIYII